jgi:hypothetical protein
LWAHDFSRSAEERFRRRVAWIVYVKIQTLLEGAEQSTGRIASLVSGSSRDRARSRGALTHEVVPKRAERRIANSRTFVSPRMFRANPAVRGYRVNCAGMGQPADNAADAVIGGGEIAIETRR